MVTFTQTTSLSINIPPTNSLYLKENRLEKYAGGGGGRVVVFLL